MLAIRSQLTHREREVLYLLATGQTDRKIAESLTISPRTVSRHVSNIFGKLEVPSRAAAAVHAVRSGLI
jgi:DNA-binding NarL/FixJ family response regulator